METGEEMNIKQASEFTGISRDMIRFYEKKGIIHPRRTENGYREYSEHDLILLVTARQYNCIGIELDRIAELLIDQDPVQFQQEMSDALVRLQEETDWLAQRMDYAEHLKNIFRMASEGIDHEVVRHAAFHYYPRTNVKHFASLYAYNSARPVFRIQNQNLFHDIYPMEQGMLFMKPVGSDLPCTSYPEGRFMRFVRRVPPGSSIQPELILPMVHQLEEEGYSLKGDVFIFLVMGDAEFMKQDLSSFEFEIG